ncbi:Myo-inositol-1-phosphate synthase [Marasmius sp. AFHP31]|nr:Myo-inositol-1-phosphate synthase [Marasmius sp. AFHP31]
MIQRTDKQAHLEHIRVVIRDSQKVNELDCCYALSIGKTEHSSHIISGINDTADSLLTTIRASHSEGATLFAGVAILEGEPSVNGVLDLPEPHYPVIRGDDLKSGYLDQVESAILSDLRKHSGSVHRDYTTANKEAHVADDTPGKDKHVGFELINMDIRKSKKDNELKHILVCETLNVPSASSPHRHQNLPF